MTPNVNFFERIDDYCLDLLDAGAKAEFEAEMLKDAKLREEVKLRMEIQSAISELDVTNLRNKLKNVAAHNPIAEQPQTESFDLFTDFSDFKELSEELSSEELINYFDSMPKVHVHQHEIAGNENIHHFYKEQEEAMNELEGEGIDDLDLDEFEGLKTPFLKKISFNSGKLCSR